MEMTTNEIKMAVRKAQLVAALEDWPASQLYVVLAPYFSEMERRAEVSREQARKYKNFLKGK